MSTTVFSIVLELSKDSVPNVRLVSSKTLKVLHSYLNNNSEKVIFLLIVINLIIICYFFFQSKFFQDFISFNLE